MIKTETKLINRFKRPVMAIAELPAIIDTGALVPMTTLSGEVLQVLWDAELIKKDMEIGGIGGKTTGSLYRLHHFEVAGMEFSDIDIYATDKPIAKEDFIFLLSATLFHGTRYQIDDLANEKILTVEFPDSLLKNRTFYVKDLAARQLEIDGVLYQEEIDSPSKEEIMENFRASLREALKTQSKCTIIPSRDDLIL